MKEAGVMGVDANGRSHRAKGLPQGLAGTFDRETGGSGDADVTPAIPSEDHSTLTGVDGMLHRAGLDGIERDADGGMALRGRDGMIRLRETDDGRWEAAGGHGLPVTGGSPYDAVRSYAYAHADTRLTVALDATPPAGWETSRVETDAHNISSYRMRSPQGVGVSVSDADYIEEGNDIRVRSRNIRCADGRVALTVTDREYDTGSIPPVNRPVDHDHLMDVMGRLNGMRDRLETDRMEYSAPLIGLAAEGADADNLMVQARFGGAPARPFAPWKRKAWDEARARERMFERGLTMDDPLWGEPA